MSEAPAAQDFDIFITRQGTQKGPFSVAMLRQMRADEMLQESEFTPEEWAALVQVLDQSELRETSFWSRKALVRIKKAPKPREIGLKNLLLVFTWIGYALGAALVVWGILRSEERLPWESPGLCASVFFSVLLARTSVGRMVRKRLLSGSRKQTSSDAYGRFLPGLLPLIILTLGAVAAASCYQPLSALVQVGINAGCCLGAGFLLSFRIPSAYFSRWRYLALSPLEPYSAGWMALPFAVFFLLILAQYPNDIPYAKEVIGYAKRLVFVEDAVVEIPEWQFPAQIGAPRSRVEKALGKPERVEEGESWHGRPGVGVSYDARGRVIRLRFAEPTPGETPVAIAWGLTDASDQKALWRFLGTPKGIMSFKAYQACTWERPPFRVTAEVWNEDHSEAGKAHVKGGLKGLEIVALDAQGVGGAQKP